MNKSENILIIRLGALGDFIQSFYAFEAIRQYHVKSRITLLTTQSFVKVASKSPWFDHILVDEKPSLINIMGWYKLKQKIQGFDFIYDLQTSRRSSRYFKLVNHVGWSGIAKGASHFHDNPQRNFIHTVDRQRDQLQKVGISSFPDPDLSWFCHLSMQAKIEQPYMVIVPGCSLKRPEKRWSIEKYSQVANLCVQKGLIPVIIGSSSEDLLVQYMMNQCPQIINLVGKTDLMQLGSIMKNARYVIGNDTGPMHIAGIVGAECWVLFSSASNPKLTAPVGKNVHIIYRKELNDLSVNDVVQELNWAH